MKKTGAEIFCESLRHEGVKTVFGLPGGVVLKIFDVLCQQKDIELVLTRHEQGAAHMAEGYAKATGKPWGGLGDVRARDDQHSDRTCRRLYGLRAAGRIYRPSVHRLDW